MGKERTHERASELLSYHSKEKANNHEAVVVKRECHCDAKYKLTSTCEPHNALSSQSVKHSSNKMMSNHKHSVRIKLQLQRACLEMSLKILYLRLSLTKNTLHYFPVFSLPYVKENFYFFSIIPTKLKENGNS